MACACMYRCMLLLLLMSYQVLIKCRSRKNINSMQKPFFLPFSGSTAVHGTTEAIAAF